MNPFESQTQPRPGPAGRGLDPAPPAGGEGPWARRATGGHLDAFGQAVLSDYAELCAELSHDTREPESKNSVMPSVLSDCFFRPPAKVTPAPKVTPAVAAVHAVIRDQL